MPSQMRAVLTALEMRGLLFKEGVSSEIRAERARNSRAAVYTFRTNFKLVRYRICFRFGVILYHEPHPSALQRAESELGGSVAIERALWVVLGRERTVPCFRGIVSWRVCVVDNKGEEIAGVRNGAIWASEGPGGDGEEARGGGCEEGDAQVGSDIGYGQ